MARAFGVSYLLSVLLFRHIRKLGWGGSPIGAFAIPKPDFCGDLTKFTCSLWSSCYRWLSWRSVTRVSAGRFGALWNVDIIWRRGMRKFEILFFFFGPREFLNFFCSISSRKASKALIKNKFVKFKITKLLMVSENKYN